MYAFLNVFFFAFHTALILFNITGWMFCRTRRWNLLALTLTAASWTIMGLWYGWGYCLCTDWHWQVRERLGYRNDPHGFIHLLLRTLTGIDFPPSLTYMGTLIGFLISLAASVALNVRDFVRERRGQAASRLLP